MFDSLELRKVVNGYVVSINSADGEEPEEYCFDTLRKTIKFIREKLDPKDKTE